MKFPKLVIDEAKALKKHAMKYEKDRLDFVRLEATSTYRCIYGQMTGWCYSERAVELIEKCAKRVYVAERGVSMTTESHLNGSPKTAHRDEYWSPIEVFIGKEDEGANEKLVKFIKGEIKSL